MGDRRCCCGAGCWSAADDFEWGPTTDLTEDWDECTGDWEVVEYPAESGNMVLRANEAGLVVWLKSPDANVPRTGIMQVKIYAPTEGAHYRLYAWYDDACGEGTWIAADLVVGASNSAVLKLIDASGPVDSSAGTAGVTGTLSPTSFTLELCVGLNHIVASVSTFLYPVRYCHDEEYNDQLYFALSNESETDIAMFDDAYQIDHYDHNPECPTCDCSCDGHCSPLKMCLTINDDPAYGGCSNIDGTSMTLSIGTTPCQWISPRWTCTQVDGYFLLQRAPGGDSGSEPCSSYQLSFINWGTGTVAYTFTPSGDCSCDPWYLKYDARKFNDVLNSKCCTGVVPGGGSAICPDGSTSADWDPNPLVEYYWCPGYFFIDIVPGECPS